jgi:hypothetical protein
MADSINLAFPDQSYSDSNKPSVVTLKGDLTTIEDAYNDAASEINDHESRVVQVGADVIDVRGTQEGLLVNGKIVTSVSSNNLTVAIKTLAGTDPSVSDPVYIRIGDVVRTLTVAKSVTLNAGTNWFTAGDGAEKDFYVFAIWNTTPAADRIDIGVSRCVHPNTYSRHSATPTVYNYLGYSGSDAPASTDKVVSCGNFDAVLSTGAGYTWSLPTARTDSRPTLGTYTAWTTYTPTFSAATGGTIGNGTIAGRYTQIGKLVTLSIYFTFGSTTDQGSGQFKFTTPVAASASTYGFFGGIALGNQPGQAAYTGLVGFAGDANHVVIFAVGVDTVGGWGINQPAAWSTGEEIRLSITYEAA